MPSLRPLPGSFDQHTAHLEDPRLLRTRRYELTHLLFMAFCAVLAGSQGWSDIAGFATDKRAWFELFFELPSGTPCACTFRRLFERLPPHVLVDAFSLWIDTLRERLPGEVLAFDGKAIRSAFEEASRTTPLHMLSVWSVTHQLVLTHRPVAGAPGEVAGIEELLRLIDVRGCVLTSDANGCTRDITAAIVAAGADYQLALKGNRGPIHEATVALFADPESQASTPDETNDAPTEHVESDKGHGRRETRTTRVLSALRLSEALRARWPSVRSLVAIQRERTVGGETSVEMAYFLSSERPDACRQSSLARAHWSIENQQHWILDVTMGEDTCGVRDETSGANLGTLRRMALNLLQHADAGPGSVVRKQQKANRSDAYLLQLLTAGRDQTKPGN
ncbi:MAG: ISAs1 family transposase [Myxococcales bacterium]|nr:MAG: ISAs1 family transposase [Myxococcales bacterium]